MWGDLATGSREAESEVELAFVFAFGLGRRCAVPLVGRSLRVERRTRMRLRLCDEELVARSVEIDAGRELLDPLGYGEGRNSERDPCVGLLAEAGGRQAAVVASGKGYATWRGR